MQDKTTCLDSALAKISLHINNGKTKILRMQQASNSQVTVAGQSLEEVNSFNMVGIQAGAVADMRARIGKGQTACLILKKVWSSRETGRSNKMRIFHTNMKSVLNYGSETWQMTQAKLLELQTFINSYLHKILCIHQ